MNAPAAWPSASDDKAALQSDRDDRFARLLDDERDRTADAEAAPPPPPPPPPPTPERPEPVEATSNEPADNAGAEDRSATAAEFKAALNALNSDAAETSTDNSTTEQAGVDAADTGEAAATAKPGATAVAMSATQTNAALLALANATGEASATDFASD